MKNKAIKKISKNAKTIMHIYSSIHIQFIVLRVIKLAGSGETVSLYYTIGSELQAKESVQWLSLCHPYYTHAHKQYALSSSLPNLSEIVD